MNLRFEPGEIHAVLGENGAGKSTLVSILSGFVRPDEGRVLFEGAEIPFGRPSDSKRLGIEMIHQHFTLVPQFSVAENLALSRLGRLDRYLDLQALSNEPLAMARDLGWEFDPAQLVRTLTVGAQQRLEILKAISGATKIIIFDEPTAVLTPQEVNDLFRVLRDLRNSGKIVILIAHKLAEVLAVADRVSVLRKGQFVGSALARSVDARTLAEWMVGDLPPESVTKPVPLGLSEGVKIVDLTVRESRGIEAVRGVSLEIMRGEILGIGGVDGNGQTELAEALAGVRDVESGSISFDGSAYDPERTRIAYIPQDRQSDGLAMRMSVGDNLMVTGYRKPSLSWGPFLNPSRARQWQEGLVRRFSIKVDSVLEPVSSLSGGNQQKVVVSRSLDEQPELLVVVSPTRGLDLKATAFVHEKIRETAAAGAAVLVVSTDIDELSSLAHRVLFMSRGRLSVGSDALALVGGPGD